MVDIVWRRRERRRVAVREAILEDFGGGRCIFVWVLLCAGWSFEVLKLVVVMRSMMSSPSCSEAPQWDRSYQ